MQMNSFYVNLHDYCSKLVNLYSYTQIDVDHFQKKLCKFYTFFYSTRTDVNAKLAEEEKNKNKKLDL